MAKNHGCGCSERRNSNSAYGCLNSVGGRYHWDNYPYYGGPCPDADGAYDRDDCRDDCRDSREGRRRGRRRCGREGRCGIFSAMLPIAVAANGIVPLVNCGCAGGPGGFPVNCGLITLEEEGTYLATYTVRVPEGAAVASTFTLNVNDASQSSAVAEVGGQGPVGYTAQAIFDACERTTVALRSSEAINLTDTSVQPLVTLSLVRLDAE